MKPPLLTWNTFVWRGTHFYRVSWWTSKDGGSSITTTDKGEFQWFLGEKYRELGVS